MASQRKREPKPKKRRATQAEMEDRRDFAVKLLTTGSLTPYAMATKIKNAYGVDRKSAQETLARARDFLARQGSVIQSTLHDRALLSLVNRLDRLESKADVESANAHLRALKIAFYVGAQQRPGDVTTPTGHQFKLTIVDAPRDAGDDDADSTKQPEAGKAFVPPSANPS